MNLLFAMGVVNNIE